MIKIQKRPVPDTLTEWRVPRLAAIRAEGMGCTYEEMRRDTRALAAVEDGLLAEQGGLCAYTGHRISLTVNGDRRDVNFHLEHLTPQAYCKAEFNNYGKDADYNNLVACWPRPNVGFEPAYGAKKKGNWPTPTEELFFLSPLQSNCSTRFSFNGKGEIAPVNQQDAAAKETIRKLGLDHPTLTDLRREAIRGALNKLSLAQARKLLAHMEQALTRLSQGQAERLIPFCFAIQPALEREIKKLEAIQQQRRN